MALFSDEAISLRRIDYSETSQIIVLLTRKHGKLRVIAKGSKRSTKKRFAAGIDLLERGVLVFASREDRQADLATLTEWTQRVAYSGLRTNLRSLYAAQYLCEITAALLEDGDPHPRLYDALSSALSRLSEGGEALSEIVRCQVTLLAETGLMPDLTQCTSCTGTIPDGVAPYFSSESGGLICRDCEPAIVEKRSVPAAAVRFLRDMPDETGVSPQAAAGAFELLNYHIGYTLGRPPKLAEYLLPTSR